MKLARSSYGISRIDQDAKRSHGWFVRVRVRGVPHVRFFSDKRHGGKLAALEAARACRDAWVKKLPKERQEALARRRRRPKRSGIKGITRVLTRNQAGQVFDYWQASWVDEEGKRRAAKFSVAKYGEKKALELAKKHLLSLGLTLEPLGTPSILKKK